MEHHDENRPATVVCYGHLALYFKSVSQRMVRMLESYRWALFSLNAIEASGSRVSLKKIFTCQTPAEISTKIASSMNIHCLPATAIAMSVKKSRALTGERAIEQRSPFLLPTKRAASRLIAIVDKQCLGGASLFTFRYYRQGLCLKRLRTQWFHQALRDLNVRTITTYSRSEWAVESAVL